MREGSCERSAATAPCADRFLVGLVDDDMSFREALQGWLSSCGVRVAAFTSGEELLTSEDLDQVCCLVLDVRMPGMDGIALCKAVKSLRVDLPVVFVSSQDDAKTRELAIEAGAADFLGKPLDSTRLLALIETMRGG